MYASLLKATNKICDEMCRVKWYRCFIFTRICFLQVHIGGHIVEFDPTSGRVKVSVDGSAYDIADGEEKDHMEGDETIFRYKIF
jgi:hypothetical protein